jgi:hypothetical protein
MENTSITFLNIEKDQKIVIQVTGDMTFKQIKAKYATKSDIPLDKIDQTFTFYYQGYKLDLNSDEQISQKFRVIADTILVQKKEENKSIVSENKSLRDCLCFKNNFINNDASSRFNNNNNNNMNNMNNMNSMNMNNMNNNTDINSQEAVTDLLEDMAFFGSLEKQIIEKEVKEEPDKFISIFKCLNSEDDQFFILGILANYFIKIGIKPFIENANVTTKESEQMQANTLLQFICNGYILKRKYILDFNLSPKRLEQLNGNINDEQNKFHGFLKRFLSKKFNIENEKIIVKNFVKSRDLYSIIIVFKSDFKISQTKEEILDLFHKEKQPDFKNLVNFEEGPIFEYIRLNRSMLDSRGNNKSDSCWGFNETRGGENYYPPVGWWRYGLRVFNKYDKGNNDWLSYDNRSGEWSIAYSGLSGMKNEVSNKYENDIDTKHGGKVGLGVYVSPKPEVMEENTEIININGINFKMGLMLRVEPSKIKKPQSNNRVWVIGGTSSEIRPYGILLKKMS